MRMLVAFMALTSFLLFWLYLRRMLKHLDPSQAVPPHVRAALDIGSGEHKLVVAAVNGTSVKVLHSEVSTVLLAQDLTRPGGDGALSAGALRASKEALNDLAERAARLCKADLVSEMVYEFPELQGLMGGKYLLEEGEAREVALAVAEHYQPAGAGDAPPTSDAGALLALAERIELLLSIFAKGQRPTGSSDPYALRRAGNGIVQILWNRGWRLPLQSLFKTAATHWAERFPAFKVEASALANDLGQLLRQRMVSQFEEDGFEIERHPAFVCHIWPDQGGECLFKCALAR